MNGQRFIVNKNKAIKDTYLVLETIQICIFRDESIFLNISYKLNVLNVSPNKFFFRRNNFYETQIL